MSKKYIKTPDETKNGHQNYKAQQLLTATALQNYDVVRYIVEERNIHPDMSFGGKPTAICYAGLKKDRCLMMYLRRHGASVNIQDRFGMSPLHYATLGGCRFCVAYLIYSGADIEKTNHNGQTAFSISSENSRLVECRNLLKRYKVSGCRFEDTALYLH